MRERGVERMTAERSTSTRGGARRGLGPTLAACVLLLAVAAGGPGRVVVAAEPAGPQDRLAQALRGMDKGDWYWAKKVVDGLGSRPLGLYARWRELMEAADQPSFKAYAEFLARHPDWPSLGVLQGRAEETIDEGVEHRDRLAFFAEREPRTRQGRIRQAQALLAAGRRGEAAALLRQSWVVDDFPLEEERYFLGFYRDHLRTEDHEARLDRLLWDGQVSSAQRMLPFVRGDLDLLATARIRLQGLEKKAEAAVAAVPKALRGDPGLRFDQLRWHARRGREAEAQALLARPPERLVRPELWWEHQNRAIRDLVDDKAFAAAYQIARAHRQPGGAPFADGEWLAGWIALRFLKRPDDAGRHFERLWSGVTSAISRGRAAYWAGRAAEAAGRRAEAREWYDRGARYPATFYGQLAAAEVGVDLGALLAPRARASAAARDALRRREAAAVATALCRLDARAPAQPFFRHLGHTAARSADALRAVVDLAEECGRADLAVIAAKAAAREGADVEPHAAFPAPALRGFRAADATLAEPPLRLAVARQESQFDPRVSSPAGALGLMQLLPSTAQSMAGKLGLPYSKTRLTRDAEYNARLGSYYLARQLDRFDQAPALALAAYNAGPSRVVRWLEAYGDPRGEPVEALVDWIEMIPFGETRNYVQRVLEARGVYAVLLRREKGGTPAAKQAAGTDAKTTPVTPKSES
jgi:soluble lytic murein transglycosylase